MMWSLFLQEIWDLAKRQVLGIKFWLDILLDRMYQEVLEKYPLVEGDELLRAVKAWDVDAFGELFFNHLEVPIFKRYPELEKVKRAFLEAGSPFTLMSGSGSTVFAFRTLACRPPVGLKTMEVKIV